MADKIDPRAPVVSRGSDPIPQKTSGDTRGQELAKSVLPVPQQPSSSIFGTFASWFTGPRVTDSAPDASLGKEGADAVVALDISEEESDADFVVLTSGGDEPVLEELTSAEESTFVMIDEADTAEEPKIPEALQRFRRVIKNYEDQLNRHLA